MKKLFLHLLVVILFTQNNYAQNWTYYKDFPVNVTPVDIVSNNVGTLFMITSDNRIFYKLINSNWTEILNPTLDGPISPASITVSKSTNKFYIADWFSGGLYSTSNFGASWQHSWLTTNPVTGFHESISELSNISNSNVFFGKMEVGDFIPKIVKYTNQGANGQIIQYDPTNNPNNSIAELLYTSSNKLLIGTVNGGILMSNDNGTTFQQTNLTQHQIYRFTEDSTGRVYALGYNIAQDQIFLSYSDDYVNWTTMDLPNVIDRYTTIYFDNTSNYLWLGSENGIYRIYISPTSTTAWSSASFNNNQQYLVKILGDNNGGLYNFSYNDIAQKLNSFNNTWNTINAGFTGVSNYAAFGQNSKLFSATYTNNTISSTTSATASWENKFLGGQVSGIQNLTTRPNGKVYANLSLSLKKSIDNGISYSDITPPNLTNFIRRFAVGENNSLFVVKSNEENNLYWSQDDGSTWSILNTFQEPINYFSQDSNGVIYVTLSSFEVFSGIYKIFYSTDNGVSWNFTQYNLPDALSFDSHLYSKDNITIANVGTGYFVYDYLNPSGTFTIINPPQGLASIDDFIKIDNVGNYYYFYYNLYKSTDGGQNWSNLGKPDPINTPYIDNILFDSDNKAYIVTNQPTNPTDKGIYYVTENLGVENINFENSISVYPNPTQNNLNIQSQETIKEASVYDMLGKKVNVTQISNNTLDVSNLAQGMYFIKIITENDKTFTTKFIKN